MPRKPPIIVLKLGGSVLACEADVARAVHEIYRWSRAGHPVLAVVSAIGDATDRLLAGAGSYGHAPSPEATAALVATGETTSAAHLWLGCDRAGLDAVALEPADIGLRVDGPSLDARPRSVDVAALRRALDAHAAVIVPGFVGIDDRGRRALLGRGGSDLTAVLLAHALGARCRLVKDVDGLYERDPARPGPYARRYAQVTFDDAEALDGAILQAKALRHAHEHGFAFEVASLAADHATLVGAPRTTFADDDRPLRRRVALLGFGVVGRGVWQHLLAERQRFDPIGVAVRSAKRHADAIAPRLLRGDALALARDPSANLVVETMGGVALAYDCVAAALARGTDVVTANKTLLAAHGPELERLALASGARLRFSAAVGGAAPALEAVERLAGSGIERLDGILNGTCNVILDRLLHGAGFDDALAEAQALGFAEADPSADIDGHDAGEKLLLLARRAFPSEEVEEASIELRGIRGLDRIGPTTRLVASAWRSSGRLRLRVGPVDLPPEDPLAGTRGEWNALRITLGDGRSTTVTGKGAGRWPTAEAVHADLLDLWRAGCPASAEREACHA